MSRVEGPAERAATAVAALAATQSGLVRYDQAVACGMSRHAIRHRVARGWWVVVLPRVYLTTPAVPTPGQSRLAAVLSQRRPAAAGAHPTVALYGVTSLQQWGVAVDLPVAKINHLVVEYGAASAAPPGVQIHRSRHLDAHDVVVRAGIPVTRLERAAAEAASQIRRYADYVALVADAVQKGRTTVERLQVEADSRAGMPGNAQLQRALRAVHRGDRSVAECALADMIERSGVTPPVRGRVLATRIGGVITDFLWPELGLYAEVDGRDWHLCPADWAHDLDRQNALTELGLTPLRYTAAQVLRGGGGVAAEIRRELNRRSRDSASSLAARARPRA